MRIIDLFDQGVRYYADKEAFVDNHSSYTYAEADRQIHRIAAAIHGSGYGKGTRIGVYSRNSNAAWLALLALMRAEGIWLPINPRNNAATNIDLGSRFGMDMLFYDSCFNEQVMEIRAAVPSIREFICIDGAGSVGGGLAEFTEGHGDFHQTGHQQVGELAAIFPTGGTTGESKGVLMNHEALETFAANYYAHFHYHENSVNLIVAPMTHAAGILGCLHFMRGGKNVVVKNVDPLSIMQDIEAHSVTHLFLPPTLMYMMLAHGDVGKYDYSSLQHFIVGAAPTSLEKLKEAVAAFGRCMSEAYGQVEAPAAITLKAPWDYLDDRGDIDEERLKSIGRPGCFNQVKILCENGEEAPRGQPGEICVTGRLVTQGYLDDPEATAETFRNGWLWTGDVGIMDENGYIRIIDRRKDMIISGGFNVYPNEVEQVLMEHAAVQEAAVIGVPDEKWGEAVKGIIQLRPGKMVSETELLMLVKEKLGGVKTPKSIDFIEDFPKSAAGKVLKTELRKPHWRGRERAVN